jgi:predicted RNA-binding protein with PIN domain
MVDDAADPQTPGPGPLVGEQRRTEDPGAEEQGPVEPGTEPAGPELPARVRALLVGVSAEVLGGLDPADVPGTLRQVHRFAPRRRSTAGAAPLWAALENDRAFRAKVARTFALAHPDLVAAADDEDGAEPDPGLAHELPDSPRGTAPDAAPSTAPGEAPVDTPRPPAGAPPDTAADRTIERAAAIWLARPEGWADQLTAVLARLAERAGAADPAGTRTALAAHDARERAEERLAVVTAQLGSARAETQAVHEEVVALRREQRRLRSDADRARSEGRRLAAQAQEDARRAEALRDEANEVLVRALAAQRAADAERTRVRQEARVARDLADARVRLLLDTLVEAGQGLRAELALPPVADRPADLVTVSAPQEPARPTSRGRAGSDPALLDELLALPQAHLVVDGYNVSKAAYGHLALVDQRRRLVEALANVAGRTGAEVTCCFDGQEGQGGGGYPRGVRVLFSVGEIADDLIRRLVRAEPRGRVVVVVTSDQQVASDVQASGARAVPSQTLIARLARV